MDPMHAVATALTLRALLEDAVDYAGLFPPAQLGLPQAVRQYDRYRREPESWMLGRFVAPASRYGELRRLAGSIPHSGSWPLSILGSRAAEPGEFSMTLRNDLLTVSASEQHTSAVHTESMELRWPGDTFTGNRERILSFLHSLQQPFSEIPTGIGILFLEIPPSVCKTGACELLTAFAACNAQPRHSDAPVVGAKLRCGGAEAEAFPSVAEVAGFLTACTEAGVPFKLTAGLHHPLYHLDPAMAVHAHGFLNVFTASVLLNEQAISPQDVPQLLQDGDVTHFSFATDELNWQGRSASLPAVRKARRKALHSFGSCSFEEPRDDLRALGLL